MTNQPIGSREAALQLLVDRQNELILKIIILGHQVDDAHEKRRATGKQANTWPLIRLYAENKRLNDEYETIRQQLVALDSSCNPATGYPVANEL